MAIAVTTRNGQEFWRCGIKFGNEPTIVEEAALAKSFFTSPAGQQKKPPTVEEVLKSDPGLICMPASKSDEGSKGKAGK